MLVLAIGGPLDGELQEVREGHGRWLHVPRYSYGSWIYKSERDSLLLQEHDVYHIANGIARHESVSEEEVARRVHALTRSQKSACVRRVHATE